MKIPSSKRKNNSSIKSIFRRRRNAKVEANLDCLPRTDKAIFLNTYFIKVLNSCCGFASIYNQRTTQLLSHSFPPPWWDGEENPTEKRQKLMGRDENSLTKWQREKKIITVILIKRIYRMQCSHHPMLNLLQSRKSLSLSQLLT